MRRLRLGIGILVGILLLGVLARLVLQRPGASDQIRAGFRARGYPVDEVELDAWYRHVPSASNAAPMLLEAVGQLRPVAGRKSPYVDAKADPPRRGEPWSMDQRETLTALVRANAEGLGLLRAALQLPESRYPVNLKQGFNALLPHLAGVKQAAQYLRAAAMEAVLTGNGEEAVRRMEEQLMLAGTLAPEPVVISQLVRLAILQIAAQTLQDALSQGRFSAAQLQRLTTALGAAAPHDAMGRGLVGEMCLGGMAFRMPVSQLAQPGLIGGSGPEGALVMAYGLLGFRAADEAFFLSMMRDMIEAADLEDPARLTRMDELEARLVKEKSGRFRPTRLFSGMLLPAFMNLADKAAGAEAMLAAARVACALEAFRLEHAGGLPERLEQLVPQWLPAVPLDPFDGQPLRYVRSGTGYTVYSVGEDRKDSGGRERPRGGKPVPAGSIDLPFIVERPGL